VVAWVDPAKVERVVENLLTNAGRHTTPDTPVWVKVARQRDGVLLTVEDAGGGVPQELRAALFEPFRQGPKAAAHAPGVGIGLSLVARFAELHGGRAWVQDRPGGGASFQVLLPDPADAAPTRAGR
jgi:two-component system sensor histidine kinase MtrB